MTDETGQAEDRPLLMTSRMGERKLHLFLITEKCKEGKNEEEGGNN